MICDVCWPSFLQEDIEEDFDKKIPWSRNEMNSLQLFFIVIIFGQFEMKEVD
jgi:hypothetical protein